MTPRSTVVLALGSNLGDRLANLQAAVDALGAGPGLDEVAVSPVYETAPVGGPPQPDYLNAVLVAATSLPPRAVLERGRAAEAALGRVRAAAVGPADHRRRCHRRTGTRSAATRSSRCRIPRAHERAFVLAPWHDVDPDAVIPGRGRVADLLAGAGTAGGSGSVRDARLRLPA